MHWKTNFLSIRYKRLANVNLGILFGLKNEDSRNLSKISLEVYQTYTGKIMEKTSSWRISVIFIPDERA